MDSNIVRAHPEGPSPLPAGQLFGESQNDGDSMNEQARIQVFDNTGIESTPLGYFTPEVGAPLLPIPSRSADTLPQWLSLSKAKLKCDRKQRAKYWEDREKYHTDLLEGKANLKFTIDHYKLMRRTCIIDCAIGRQRFDDILRAGKPVYHRDCVTVMSQVHKLEAAIGECSKILGDLEKFSSNLVVSSSVEEAPAAEQGEGPGTNLDVA